MKLLIDTHVLIWWLTEPSQLSASGLDLLNTDDAEVLVSVVSAYEIELSGRPIRCSSECLKISSTPCSPKGSTGW